LSSVRGFQWRVDVPELAAATVSPFHPFTTPLTYTRTGGLIKRRIETG
jgi:hypothetical protein